MFVLGDNRISSMDSRYFHFVDKEEIVGEVKASYWPISQATIQFIPNNFPLCCMFCTIEKGDYSVFLYYKVTILSILRV